MGEGTAAVPTFAEAVALFEQHKEFLLYSTLREEARLVTFEPGLIELQMSGTPGRDFAMKIGERLTQWTGQKWRVSISTQEGSASLHEQELARKAKAMQEAASHPLVASVLEQFPGAQVVGVK